MLNTQVISELIHREFNPTAPLKQSSKFLQSFYHRYNLMMILRNNGDFLCTPLNLCHTFLSQFTYCVNQLDHPSCHHSSRLTSTSDINMINRTFDDDPAKQMVIMWCTQLNL